MIEGCDHAVKSTHEAVRHIAWVSEGSCVRPHWVYVGRKCAIDSARNVERGDRTVGGAHEAVIHITRVNEDPFNRSCRVDAVSSGALEGICACTRNVERGD